MTPHSINLPFMWLYLEFYGFSYTISLGHATEKECHKETASVNWFCQDFSWTKQAFNNILNENGTAKGCTVCFTGIDFSRVPNTDKWKKNFSQCKRK